MWDIKYRPVRFTDVLGQEGAVQVLKSRLRKGTLLDTSYIFSGGHGQGKTTLARILGRVMLCSNPTDEAEPCNECDNCKDALSESSEALFEMDAASRGSVAHARSIVDGLAFAAAGASKKVYIFDEVHRMTTEAQDVLLKPLEDKRMIGIFCTTEPEKIRGPIRSRCEEYQIRRITREDVLKRMKWILGQEGVEHEDDAVLTLIDHAGGHVRDVVNRLEMLSQLGPVTLVAVREHLNLSAVSAYYKILLSLGSPAVSVKLTEEVCDLVGVEAVAEGLAEAAMNSYRLAHGMHAEFTRVDRDLAAEVYKLFGDSITRIAQYFLRSYRMTRIGLLSDIIACQSGVPSPAGNNAPVLIQVSAPAVQAPAVVQAPALPPSAPISVPLAAPVVAAPVAAPAVALPPPVAEPVAVNGAKVANLGAGDPRALTTLDTKGRPTERPRGSENVSKPTVPAIVNREEFLTPQEWSKKFLGRMAILLGAFKEA